MIETIVNKFINPKQIKYIQRIDEQPIFSININRSDQNVQVNEYKFKRKYKQYHQNIIEFFNLSLSLFFLHSLILMILLFIPSCMIPLRFLILLYLVHLLSFLFCLIHFLFIRISFIPLRFISVQRSFFIFFFVILPRINFFLFLLEIVMLHLSIHQLNQLSSFKNSMIFYQKYYFFILYF